MPTSAAYIVTPATAPKSPANHAYKCTIPALSAAQSKAENHSFPAEITQYQPGHHGGADGVKYPAWRAAGESG